jgi:putative transposase
VQAYPRADFADVAPEAGTVFDEIFRKLGVTEATFCRRTKVCAGVDLAELRELPQRREENRCLKGK